MYANVSIGLVWRLDLGRKKNELWENCDITQFYQKVGDENGGSEGELKNKILRRVLIRKKNGQIRNRNLSDTVDKLPT